MMMITIIIIIIMLFAKIVGCGRMNEYRAMVE